MISTKPLKIVLVGDPGTGKTNLWSRATRNHFNPKYEPSSAMIASSYTIHVSIQTVEADLWDFAGGEEYRCLVNSRLCDADGILLVYDISNPATFENLAAWLSLVRQATCPKTVIKLVGNKNDLLRMVSRKREEQFADDNDLLYIETSALTNSNVHLAFEGIAQELDVTMHSVSEPSTHSFIQKDPKAPSGHSDDKQEKPFQVVLIEIEQAACGKTIVCVEKPLEEANLEFIAISYRWGEVQEQVIDTKLGYMASITSFYLDDFYRLCRDMMKETDLKTIKYVWVDAICVDQNNHERRKATIYQMSNIYHRAAYILPVPDLHLEYLTNSGLYTIELYENARDFGKFIYYLLHGKIDQVVQIKEEWFDVIRIPKGMAREMLTCFEQEGFTDHLQAYYLQDADSPCHNNCQHNCYDTISTITCNKIPINCHDTPKATLDYLQYSINNCHEHPKNTTTVHENSDCALCSLQMDICKHQTKTKNESVPDANEKWLVCVLREFRYENYRNLIGKRREVVIRLMVYLENLIKDWSSRAWVVSECNIAKAKQSRKMKYWFLSLQSDWEEVEKLDFFVFDFDQTQNGELFPEDSAPQDRVTYISAYLYNRFRREMMLQLNHKSFLEMMLGCKASRNEDRFYAIFPSSEYKDMLTNREVVSSWQIDNIVSVKLKLYEMMSTKDKMVLLHLTARQINLTYSTLPAFANINLELWGTDPMKDYSYEDRPCNFDLNNDATLRLVSPMDDENGIHFHKLSLLPKTYYVVDDGDDYVKGQFEGVFKGNKRLWETLDINYVDDELVFVYMPSYIYDIDPQDLNERIDHFSLFGSFKKNKWLISEDIFRRFKGIHNYTGDFSWKYYDNSDGNTTFDIY